MEQVEDDDDKPRARVNEKPDPRDGAPFDVVIMVSLLVLLLLGWMAVGWILIVEGWI